MLVGVWRRGVKWGGSALVRRVAERQTYFPFGQDVDGQMQVFAATSLHDPPDSIEDKTLGKYRSLQSLPTFDPSSLLQPYLKNITAQVHKIVPST